MKHGRWLHADKFEKIYGKWENISIKFVLSFCILAGIFFTFWAGITSNVFDDIYAQEMAHETPDSLGSNILTYAFWVLLAWGAWKLLETAAGKDEKKLCRMLHRMVLALCVCLGVFLLVWIHIAHYTPMYDQASVYENAVEMAGGDYSTMDWGGYIYQHPYQLKLTFTYQILFRIFHTQSYRMLQYLNVVSILVVIYFGYRITCEITDNAMALFCYMVFGFTFVPLFMYSQYVYNDVFSIALTSACIWGVIKWCSTKKRRYSIIVLTAVMLGSLTRITFCVVQIAITIALLYDALKNICWRSLLLVVLCLVLSLGEQQLIYMYYEHASGMKLNSGLPFSYRLNYAMQENPNGPGTFNFDMYISYLNVANMDSEYFDIINKAELKERIQDFLSHPQTIPDFYRRKLLQQWNDHTFSSWFSTHHSKQMGSVEWSVYYGKIKKWCEWFLNRYLFVFYLSFVVGIVVLWKRKREMYHYVPLIGFTGGVLFSIVFESKGRYVMPYLIMIQPFAAIGLGQCICGFQKMKNKIKQSRA